MDIEEIIEMTITKEVGVGLEEDNTKTIIEGMTEVAVLDLDQVQEQVPVERIRCCKCREYDHFTKDCLTSKL